MITINQVGDIYQVRFKYDPAIVDMVKSVPSRRWVPEGKYWTISKDKLGFFINQLKDTKYESQVKILSTEKLGQNDVLEGSAVIPDVDISKYRYRIESGLKPFQHQIDTLKFAVNRYNIGLRSGFILADQPGLGKTLSTINVGIYNKEFRGYKHCLIICCINTAKYNWVEDINKHTNGEFSGYILGTRLRRNGSYKYDTGSKEKLDDLKSGHMYGDVKAPKLPYFLILNIEALRYKQNRKYLITEELLKLTNCGEINMIAIDEIHRNASPTSQQGKQLLKIYQGTKRTVEYVPITGTPIVNKPTDVFLPLKLIGGHDIKSYYLWCQNYCVYGGFGGYEIVRYKNIPQLKKLLQNNMLRRLKHDVLDLPDKTTIDVYVENTPYQAKLYESIRKKLYTYRDDILQSTNPMAKFLRLRQVNGSPELVDNKLVVDANYIKLNAKYQAIFDILTDIHDRGEKVIIYSNWVQPLRTLYKFIKQKYRVCCYTGTMSEADRQYHKDVFLRNPEYTVMIGTVDAMGTSHTLTSANNAIFLDEPWMPSTKQQAEDRIHRISSSKPVTIYNIITKNTVDEKVHNILYTKQSISDYIVDNRLDIKSNPELVKLLLLKE